ncbi:MAG: cytochrome c [Rhodospirillales bacterium]|nr:cytochrome c [Rhodospirillales bacterium]
MTNSAFIGVATLVILLAANASAGHLRGDPKAGRGVYNETCIACHGENGKGAIPGAPDFTARNGGLNTKSDSVLLHHLLEGFQSPNSDIGMPAKGGNDDLTIGELRNVLAYMHKAFHYTKTRR